MYFLLSTGEKISDFMVVFGGVISGHLKVPKTWIFDVNQDDLNRKPGGSRFPSLPACRVKAPWKKYTKTPWNFMVGSQSHGGLVQIIFLFELGDFLGEAAVNFQGRMLPSAHKGRAVEWEHHLWSNLFGGKVKRSFGRKTRYPIIWQSCCPKIIYEKPR